MAAPPRVDELVRRTPDGPVGVLHAGADTVHLDLGGVAVAVSSARAPGLPHALRTNLESVAARGSSAGLPYAYVESGVLHLGGRALVTRRFVDVRAPRVDAGRIPKTSPVAALGTPRPRGAGLVAESVPGLVGLGDGLTPLGDDVICGWLAAHRACGVATPEVDDAVRRALPRTTTLSATLLECALAGEVADLAGDYLRSLGTPGEAAARDALTGLGHSSGSGLADGIDLGLAQLSQAVAA